MSIGRPKAPDHRALSSWEIPEQARALSTGADTGRPLRAGAGMSDAGRGGPYFTSAGPNWMTAPPAMMTASPAHVETGTDSWKTNRPVSTATAAKTAT